MHKYLISPPGGILIAMTFWWVLPFFIRDFRQFPFSQYLASFNLYILLFVLTIIMSVFFNIWNKKLAFWNKAGYWKKYVIICGIYSLNIIIILAIVVFSGGFFEYFGGDAAGSFGMLFIPSAEAYWIIGFAICISILLYKKIKQSRASGA